MSHFPVLVVVEKESIVSNPLFDSKETDTPIQYQEQYFVEGLESLMEPYWEESQEYAEEIVEVNNRATEFLKSYMEIYRAKRTRKDYQFLLDELIVNLNSHYDDINKFWSGDSLKTKAIALDKLIDKVSTVKFSPTNTFHMNWVWRLFGEGYTFEDFSWDTHGNCHDHFYHNLDSKWDWFVVGGRWAELGNNGILELDEVFQKEMVPFVQILPFFKLPNAFADSMEEFMKDNVQEETIIKSFLKDENGNTLKDDNGKGIADKYYTVDELMKLVSVDKNPVQHFLFKDEGWIEAGEMGWFGMSSLDTLDDEEKERVVQENELLVSNILKKYKDDYVGVVVDCHI